MADKLTMLSLFSGGGMFDVAAECVGIDTVMMSEIEPFPIAVTRKHFPNAVHLGDINKIDGAKITPVDIVCGGFCCQDVSTAGKMVGLHGARSGLFFQMTRIIREMLAATDGQSPRYLVFENVPGLLSSGKGADFREVMDEIASLGFIADANILDAQEFGVAQRRKRVFIACVNKKYYDPADFADVTNNRDKRMQKALDAWASIASEGGDTFHGIASRPHEVRRQKLSEILESNVDNRYYLTKAACAGILRRVDSKGKEIPRLLRSALESQAELFTAPNTANGEPMTFEAGATARLPKGKYWSGIAPTLRSDPGDNLCSVAFQAGSMSRLSGNHAWEEVSPTLRAEAHSGDNACSVAIPIDERNAVRNGGSQGVGVGEDGQPSYTVTAEYAGAVAVENHLQDFRLKITGDTVQSMCRNMGGGGQNVPLVLNQREQAMTVGENVANTMSATQYKAPQAVCVQGNIIGRKPENGANGKGVNDEISYTLTEVDRHAVCYQDTAPTLTTELSHQNGNGIMTGGGAVVEEVYSMTAGSFTQVNDNIAPNLMARDFKDPPFVNAKPAFGIDRAAYNQGANALYKPQIDVEGVHSLTAQGPAAVSAPPAYVVRRLTPTECLVLMGLPRDYAADLGIAEPTEEDIAFWQNVFETHRVIVGTSSKPKTRNKIAKFLKNPYSDSACYRLAGNGAVVSVCEFVLEGLTVHNARRNAQ
ncbi:hypothetical protein FACS1894132_06720 [Clostridia bacterium]|nr:hypothetical protein FACS1894132_06720 [Clostridia bacterium]